MKNIMYRMHQITETLQSPELNIIYATAIIQSTVELLKKTKDDHDSMNHVVKRRNNCQKQP